MTYRSTEARIAAGLTVGLDVSDTYTSLCILDEEGNVIEEGRVRTTTPVLARRFSALPPCRIVLEVGTHSPWMSRLLAGLGHEVIVANPRQVRLIAESDRKRDRTDAELLARLGRVDPALLRPIQHRGPQAQQDLALLRARDTLVGARTKLINHVRGAVKATPSGRGCLRVPLPASIARPRPTCPRRCVSRCCPSSPRSASSRLASTTTTGWWNKRWRSATPPGESCSR